VNIINVETPNTIILGVHVESVRLAAVVGSLVADDGALRVGVIERFGAMWEAISDALTDAETIGAANVILLTNSKEVFAALTPCRKKGTGRMPVMAGLPSPRGGERQRVWNGVRGDGRYVDVELGDPKQWQVLCALGFTFAGRWRVQLVETLPNAKALHEGKNRLA